MPESAFVFERGTPITVGKHGQTDFVLANGTPVENSGRSTTTFEDGIGLGSGFPNVLRSDDVPGTVNGDGVGGDADVIWFVDSGEQGGTGGGVYELDPSDFSVVQSREPAPNTSEGGGGGVSGIGGDATVIWASEVGDTVYELDPSDLSTVRSSPAPSAGLHGMGGTANVIWACDVSTDTIYELSTSDFSIVRSATSPGPLPIGIGGDESTIWLSTDGDGMVYELDPTDFSVVREGPAPSDQPRGVGGDSNTLWYSDGYPTGGGNIHELST